MQSHCLKEATTAVNTSSTKPHYNLFRFMVEVLIEVESSA